MQLIECVPNISEGKNTKIIEKIVSSVKDAGVKILGVEMNRDANRTVLTFAGGKQEVFEAAFNCVKTASELIDMRAHKGAHPRLGAVDVCPFIPLQDVNMQECIYLSKELGGRVAVELGLPVYLYCASTHIPERESLAYIRKGGYETLEEKLKTLPPDYGPNKMSAAIERAGALVTGARDFLVAYNITLNTPDAAKAAAIAKKLREGARLKGLKTLGWFMDSYGAAQVSCNVTDFKATPLYKIYEACKAEAKKLELEVAGSEIVGLVPKEAILQTGRRYAEGDDAGEESLVHLAAEFLNLNLHARFLPQDKIIEYKLASLYK